MAIINVIKYEDIVVDMKGPGSRTERSEAREGKENKRIKSGVIFEKKMVSFLKKMVLFQKKNGVIFETK